MTCFIIRHATTLPFAAQAPPSGLAVLKTESIAASGIGLESDAMHALIMTLWFCREMQHNKYQLHLN